MMIRLILVMCCACLASSCAEVRYLDEAMRLKEYSDEGDARDAMIVRRQGQFQELCRRVAAGDPLNEMVTQQDLTERLGSPVLVATNAGTGEERWLYRDPVRYFDTPKVYFFLDPRGKVIRWEASGIISCNSSSTHEAKSR